MPLLWNEVHITSVLPPEQLYENMVMSNRRYDNIEQLKRRINYMVYHYKSDDNFFSFQIDMKDYTTYDDLCRMVGECDMPEEWLPKKISAVGQAYDDELPL